MHDFLSNKFHEIWTQHVDQSRNENFRNIILTILLQWVIFPGKSRKICFKNLTCDFRLL